MKEVSDFCNMPFNDVYLMNAVEFLSMVAFSRDYNAHREKEMEKYRKRQSRRR